MTISNRSITKATVEDVPALVALVNSAYRGDSSRAGWTTEADLLEGIRIDADGLNQQLTAAGSSILKYVEDDTVLACVHLQKRSSELYLGMLTVSPQLQGKGIGKQLLKAAEEFAAAEDCDTIAMTVITLRKELLEWYERNGYQRTGQLLPFPTDPRFGIPKQALEFEVLRKRLQTRKDLAQDFNQSS